MGHYDEYYEEHYAELRKQKQERYEKVQRKYEELRAALVMCKTNAIAYHMDMLDALIQREMR
jgi:thiamine kinase-like enzyme